MKKKQFNPRVYQGKDRIERTVSNNIVRVWSWNTEKKQYESGSFLARRWEPRPEGGKKQVRQAFESLEAARAWQAYLFESATSAVPLTEKSKVLHADQCPSFGEVYADFYKRKVSKKSRGTQQNYDRYVRLYFQKLMPLPIRSITAKVVDEWIDSLHESIGRTSQSRSRVSFDHELSVLRCILKFYASECDDDLFVMPLRDRHAENIKVRASKPRHSDLTVAEFELFRAELAKGKNGAAFAAMSTLQFEQALRISEAAGLFHEDVVLHRLRPQESIVRLCRHVFYPRRGNEAPAVLPGFKNSKGGATSTRTVHLFPRAYEALESIGAGAGKGLVFGNSPLQPFTYRQIQKAYDSAFKRAGLPYRGTHILRHGGARRILNETEGDLTLAQMVLGHEDLESTLVYAKRSSNAFSKHVENAWSVGRANARKESLLR